MDAVLPWQSASLDARYQEPNCSFGGHALTVSLWKLALAPNRIVGYIHSPMGALVGLVTCPPGRIAQHQSAFRQQGEYSRGLRGCQYASILGVRFIFLHMMSLLCAGRFG
jgi:hypothetical protein